MDKFEELLQAELDKLPYTKHLDDGQYNDGQMTGFELGARWALSLFAVSGQSELLLAFGNFITSNTANLNYSPDEWVKMFLESNSH